MSRVVRLEHANLRALSADVTSYHPDVDRFSYNADSDEMEMAWTLDYGCRVARLRRRIGCLIAVGKGVTSIVGAFVVTGGLGGLGLLLEQRICLPCHACTSQRRV